MHAKLAQGLRPLPGGTSLVKCCHVSLLLLLTNWSWCPCGVRWPAASFGRGDWGKLSGLPVGLKELHIGAYSGEFDDYADDADGGPVGSISLGHLTGVT